MTRAVCQLLDFAPLLLFGIVLALFGSLSRKFLEPNNLVNIVAQASSTGIVAVGMTFVLLTAGIVFRLARLCSSPQPLRER